jgi:hypothetical protein
MPQSGHELSLYAPAWWLDPSSGLWKPTTLDRAPAAPRPEWLPAELRPPAQAVALHKGPPSELDQMAVFADEPAAELPVSSLAEIGAMVRAVPFESAIRGIARVTAAVYAFEWDSDAQLRLAEQIFGQGSVLDHLRAFVRREAPHGRVFAEQNLMMLQRLLIQLARPAPITTPLSETEGLILSRSVLAVTAINTHLTEQARTETAQLGDWLPFFIQNGAYNRKTRPMGEMARAQVLFGRIAKLPKLQASSHACPIEEWMVEDYGLTIDEQLALGFALSAMTQAWTKDETAGSSCYIEPQNVDDLLVKLGWEDRREPALAAIAADREAFQSDFAQDGDRLSRLAWEVRPFMRHPFLLLEEGGLLLVSPRAVLSWLSEGFHYRLLDSAQRRAGKDRKLSRNYTAFVGELVEEYALELVRSVHQGQRPVGSGRVYGEQPYGRKRGNKKGADKTSDIAIDLGLDLVLIEASGSRLRAETLLSGDMKSVTYDLERMVVKKIRQLGHCIHALLAGRAQIPADKPDVDMDRVERIWPVVVTAGNLTQTGALWQHIHSKTEGALNQLKVQPLTLLDIDDLEALCGFIEYGHALPDMLAAKTTPPYRELELAVWVQHDPAAPPEDHSRPSYVEAVWGRAIERATAMIDMTKGMPQMGEAAPAA